MILLLKARRPLMLQDIHKIRMIQEESEDQVPSRVLHFHSGARKARTSFLRYWLKACVVPAPCHCESLRELRTIKYGQRIAPRTFTLRERMSFYSKILIQCKEFNVRVLVAGRVHE